MRWVKLEAVIQSEVNQKEKNKYSILMHICGIQKNGTAELICRAGIETQIQRMDLWTQWEKECEMKLEGKIDICTLPCAKQLASEEQPYSTGSSAWCSATTWKVGLEWWEGGSKERGYVYIYG